MDINEINEKQKAIIQEVIAKAGTGIGVSDVIFWGLKMGKLEKKSKKFRGGLI